MINVDDLLKPVSDDKPCGDDFTYHPSFQNLESLAVGKPETQFSPAEEPQWKDVRDAAIEVLGQSKHLTAGVLLTRSLLKTDGMDGLRDGLAVMRGLTERYWPDVYPKLDPEDNNDPTQRLNILSTLSGNKFALDLRKVVLCQSPAMGQITLDQVLSAKEKSAKGESSPELTQIQAAFRDIGPDMAKATLSVVDDAIENAKGIETFLDTTLGAGQGVNFETLNKMLGEMKQSVEPYAVDGAGGASPEGSEPATTKNNQGAARISGSIQSRVDVVKALDLICDYYRVQEPSSPVPLILQRAQRLVDKDFMTIMTDLTPEALKQLEIITGMKTKE
jgi:type VI secretion system protein ImpA